MNVMRAVAETGTAGHEGGDGRCALAISVPQWQSYFGNAVKFPLHSRMEAGAIRPGRPH